VAAFAAASAGEPVLRARAAGEGDETDDGDTDAPATATGGTPAPLDAPPDLVAQCVEAPVSTRVFSVSLGDFDTHADERKLQEVLLGQVDRAVRVFAARVRDRTASDVFLLGAGVRARDWSVNHPG
jgi:uncharacterized protein (DUF1501 family)